MGIAHPTKLYNSDRWTSYIGYKASSLNGTETRHREKHGVTFEEAAEVFFDPFYQEGDATSNNYEERDFIIGYSLSQRLLLVAYLERYGRNRIVSARPATRAERKLYEQA
ncbi:BrnT family toxin [Microcoleus sp. FACHB-831]|uniref:BrnT family toxin n=1 Tax=Microcoleus sp. FACHB-831 TaxID=2692827 RepID=UPI0028153952|nr:BrnT family toxin [Microcoleus sp. FACHB-831]